ncbi:pseudin antimicrobial peptide [Teladorsagia circumcincta]|uniref:Pseudin antimicrobial peptide n=1 Tax=Teladorsagia circumcincta TaxID=45464 RepID=A0A2G9UDM1_TELCI|nr:pseudin antimicrobial peptide [Teladorsagia circumcincta]
MEEVHSVQPGTSKASSAVYEVTTNLPKPKKVKVSKKERGFSPLLDLLDVAPVTTTNFCTTGGTLRISDVTLRRLTDLLEIAAIKRVVVTIHKVLKLVHEREQAYGYDFLDFVTSYDKALVFQIDKKSLIKCLKALENVHLIRVFETSVIAESIENRIQIMCHRDIRSTDDPEVTQAIQSTVDEYHQEGRVFPHGQLRYFWKAESEPEQFKKLFKDFEKMAGGPCPFKLGQVVKFPDSNLSTLRISDVTLRRLTDLLEIAAIKRVVVTIHKVLKLVHEREQAYGYDFLIQIMCHRDIRSTDDPEVTQAIQSTVDEYHQEGRVFPHGQLSNGIDLASRYQLLRLQVLISLISPCTASIIVSNILFPTSRSAAILPSRKVERMALLGKNDTVAYKENQNLSEFPGSESGHHHPSNGEDGLSNGKDKTMSIDSKESPGAIMTGSGKIFKFIAVEFRECIC